MGRSLESPALKIWSGRMLKVKGLVNSPKYAMVNRLGECLNCVLSCKRNHVKFGTHGPWDIFDQVIWGHQNLHYVMANTHRNVCLHQSSDYKYIIWSIGLRVCFPFPSTSSGIPFQCQQHIRTQTCPSTENILM